jgi:hypothetical protein
MRIVPTAILSALLLSKAQDRRPSPHLPSIIPSTVSGISPYPSGCQGQQAGIDYINSAVEPSVAVDPTNPQHLIGVWQQNRWSNGAADGISTAVSTDGGATWSHTSAAFSKCTEGSFIRASDPWVTISPNGIAYQIAVVETTPGTPSGILVSRSDTGGFSWGAPITITQDSNGDDKESITADPTDSNYVYAVWDLTNVGNSQPAWFSRTSDGGATWESPHQLYYPGNGYSSANQIVVLPNGTLVDVFILGPPNSSTSYVAILRSSDHGDTWTDPYIVSTNESINVVDSRTQAAIRTGIGFPSAAVDPSSGTIYVTWEDARFSQNQRDGVALSKSTDGGITWSTPVQVNRVPAVQAFDPTVAVGAGGAVAITYYDFRQATTDVTTLPTNFWQIVSSDGGNAWRESPVAGPFDMLRAVRSGIAYFLGDYGALAASGPNFVPFFVATNPAPSPSPSSIFSSPRERQGGTGWNGHIEINRNPETSRRKRR